MSESSWPNRDSRCSPYDLAGERMWHPANLLSCNMLTLDCDRTLIGSIVPRASDRRMRSMPSRKPSKCLISRHFRWLTRASPSSSQVESELLSANATEPIVSQGIDSFVAHRAPMLVFGKVRNLIAGKRPVAFGRLGSIPGVDRVGLGARSRVFTNPCDLRVCIRYGNAACAAEHPER
jgi:hypothetical protein